MTIATASPPPPSAGDAEGASPLDGLSPFYRRRYLAIVAAILFVLVAELLLLRSISVTHLAEGAADGDLATTGNLIYLLSAVVAAAAALVIAGVIVLAPLLSLSLHQSYDTLYSLAKDLFADSDPNNREIAKSCRATLQRNLRIYHVLDIPYYAIWVTSTILLFVITIRLTLGDWLPTTVFHEAMSFFVVACANCGLFAAICIVYFVLIRPGVTKLDYSVRHLKAMANEQDKNALPNTRRRDTLLILLALIAVIVVIFVAVLWRPQSGKFDLSVAENSLAVATAPLFIVDERNLMGEAEVRLQQIPFASGRLALDALLAGQADVATAAETPVLLASLNRPDIRILMTIAESPLRVIALKSSGIGSPGDLKGKRVAVVVGASSEFYLERLLAKHGLTMRDVAIINMQPPDMGAALRNKDIDAISIWEPHAQRAEDLVSGDSIAFEDQAVYLERFNLVTTQAMLEDQEKREGIRRLLASMIVASSELEKDQSAALRTVSDRVNIAPTDLAVIWPRFAFPANLSISPLTVTLHEVELWDSAAKGRSPRPVAELRELIDEALLSDVEKQRVSR